VATFCAVFLAEPGQYFCPLRVPGSLILYLNKTTYDNKMLPQERLAAVSSLLAPVTSPKRQRIYAKNSDDIVITLALRTPLTKAKKGYLKDTKLDQLLLPLLVVRAEQPIYHL
jgi:hypothetical protein